MGGGDLPGGSTSGSSEVFERAAELRYFSFWDPALNGSAVKTSLLRDSKGIIHLKCEECRGQGHFENHWHTIGYKFNA